jgi:PTH1 family peptidyl-tRNA hydrolase
VTRIETRDTWLVAGLGNPGPGYASHRHNVGQMALDVLAERIGARFSRHKTNTQLAEGRLGPGLPKLVLVKPNSFMNLSGGPVTSAAKFFGLGADRLIVLHDELDIPFDTVKLKVGGGHGGHNGLRDIQAALGTPDFARVRIGIGRLLKGTAATEFEPSDHSLALREELPSPEAAAAEAEAEAAE